MKTLCALLFVIVAGRVAIGCSDDGVYTPIESTDPVVVCDEKSGCPDASDDADPSDGSTFVDAGK